MKLLFNLEAVEGNRVRTCPGEHLNSLAHAEAETGIATEQEFLEIITTGYLYRQPRRDKR